MAQNEWNQQARLTGGRNKPFKQGGISGEASPWLTRTSLKSQPGNKKLWQKPSSISAMRRLDRHIQHHPTCIHTSHIFILLRDRWWNPDLNPGKWDINLSLLLLAEPLQSQGKVYLATAVMEQTWPKTLDIISKKAWSFTIVWSKQVYIVCTSSEKQPVTSWKEK